MIMLYNVIGLILGMFYLFFIFKNKDNFFIYGSGLLKTSVIHIVILILIVTTWPLLLLYGVFTIMHD